LQNGLEVTLPDLELEGPLREVHHLPHHHHRMTDTRQDTHH
jgi:hypothetical protein